MWLFMGFDREIVIKQNLGQIKLIHLKPMFTFWFSVFRRGKEGGTEGPLAWKGLIISEQFICQFLEKSYKTSL